MTHMGDIREKMLNYLNVMSRPINYNANSTSKKNSSFIWSYLHVDLADRRLSNWLWKKFEGIRQRKVFLDHIKRMIKREKQFFDYPSHMLLKTTHVSNRRLSIPLLVLLFFLEVHPSTPGKFLCVPLLWKSLRSFPIELEYRSYRICFEVGLLNQLCAYGQPPLVGYTLAVAHCFHIGSTISTIWILPLSFLICASVL